MTKTKRLTKSAASRARLFALRARIHMAIWLSKGLRCSEGAGGAKTLGTPYRRGVNNWRQRPASTIVRRGARNIRNKDLGNKYGPRQDLWFTSLQISTKLLEDQQVERTNSWKGQAYGCDAFYPPNNLRQNPLERSASSSSRRR